MAQRTIQAVVEPVLNLDETKRYWRLALFNADGTSFITDQTDQTALIAALQNTIVELEARVAALEDVEAQVTAMDNALGAKFELEFI